MKTTISGLKLDMVVILLSRLKMSLRNCCFSIIPKSNHLIGKPFCCSNSTQSATVSIKATK